MLVACSALHCTINFCYIFVSCALIYHDDVIKWKHFPRYWPFVRGIHRWPANSPHKGQWRGALMFSLICARINRWINHREADDLSSDRAHYDVIVMEKQTWKMSHRPLGFLFIGYHLKLIIVCFHRGHLHQSNSSGSNHVASWINFMTPRRPFV